MIPGSMSHEPPERDSVPGSDTFEGKRGVGRVLAAELHEVRERALARLQDLSGEWTDLMADVRAGERREVGSPDEILDDDLDLRERIEKCRELRASMIHQWSAAHRAPSSSDIDDLIRFSEAIDRILMESIAQAHGRARRAREMFLAVLGHDLRTPLGAVVMASEYLVTRGELTERDLQLATRIRSSGQRMDALVNDLLDFTRCRLGDGIPISPVRTSFGAIAAEVVEEIRAAHPDCELQCDIRESVQGDWDAGRLWQALSNLIENAVFHGGGTPVRVSVTAEAGDVVASVHNAGSAVSVEDQERIFDPFERVAREGGPIRGGPGGGLGLGLYIARAIAVAHGGSLTMSSSPASGTTFNLRVPLQP